MSNTTKENLQARPISDRRRREATPAEKTVLSVISNRRREEADRLMHRSRGQTSMPRSRARQTEDAEYLAAPNEHKLTLDDIWYVRATNKFYELRTGGRLAKAAVNATLGFVAVDTRDGFVVAVGQRWQLAGKSYCVHRKAAEWIMENRAVDYVTNAPGLSRNYKNYDVDESAHFIMDMRVSYDGLMEPCRGASTLNLKALRRS